MKGVLLSINILVQVPRINPVAECPEFGVLLIGETGSGKSSLLNNLLGTDVVTEGDSPNPETGKITQYRVSVAGVPIVLYDTPGVDNSSAESDNLLCKEMKKLIKYKRVCLTIFCIPMIDCRLKESHIATLQSYHKAMVNWDRTIMALTFADNVKAPHIERKREGFNKAEYFQRRISDWERHLRDTLVHSVGVPRSTADRLIMCPTTDERDAKLPNDQEWFIPLWLDILDILEPADYFRFLEIHHHTFGFVGNGEESLEHSRRSIHLTDKCRDRFWQIAKEKLFISVAPSAK